MTMVPTATNLLDFLKKKQSIPERVCRVQLVTVATHSSDGKHCDSTVSKHCDSTVLMASTVTLQF